MNPAARIPMLSRDRLLSFGAAGVAALAVGTFAPAWLAGTLRAVGAYDAAAAVMLLVIWTVALRDDATHTIRRAAAEDPGRNVVLAVVLASVAAGLASAVVILGKGTAVPAGDRALALTLGIAAVVMGWFLIHTTFIFRYAHLFYRESDGGRRAGRGLIFPGTNEPDDYDFAYFAFVLGMTFQVSDIQITDPAIRRVAMLHGLVAFGYNASIISLGVNLVSNIVNTH